MKKLLLLFTLIIFIASFLLTSDLNPAQAQTKKLTVKNCLLADYYDPVAGKLREKPGSVATFDCLGILVGNVIYWALAVSGAIAVILIIISGIKFVTSGGDPKQAEGAKKTLMWAIIGLLLILTSFWIVRALADVTGVACLTKFGFEACTTCTNDNQCGDDQKCNKTTNQCVRKVGYCTSDIQCDRGTRCDNNHECMPRFDYCCNKSNSTCKAYISIKDRYNKFESPWHVFCPVYNKSVRENICDSDSKRCVRCLKNSHCTEPGKSFCVKNPDDSSNKQRNWCCATSEYCGT